MIHSVAIRECQPVLLLLLGALLLVACATVEAPEQPESITLGMGSGKEVGVSGAGLP